MSHIHGPTRPWDVIHFQGTKTVTAAHHTDLIEGSFRLVSSQTLPHRLSPNRQRAVARMVFWNVAFMVAIVAMPILF